MEVCVALMDDDHEIVVLSISINYNSGHLIYTGTSLIILRIIGIIAIKIKLLCTFREKNCLSARSERYKMFLMIDQH